MKASRACDKLWVTLLGRCKRKAAAAPIFDQEGTIKSYGASKEGLLRFLEAVYGKKKSWVTNCLSSLAHLSTFIH